MRTDKPEYLKLYEWLRDEITKGAWPAGAKLPSRRQTAVTGLLGPAHTRFVSAVTVEHSYELLCEEGYAEARPRSGFYVAYRSADGFAGAESQARPSRPRLSPVPQECFPFSVMTRAMRRVIADYGEAILDKSPNTGCGELRAAIARYLARNRGIRVDAEQIVIGSGAEYLYGLIVDMEQRTKSIPPNRSCAIVDCSSPSSAFA